MSSEFMLQLHKRLTEKTYGDPPRNLSTSTADNYIKTLYNLNDKKPFKNLTFLKSIDTIEGKLADYAESTKKTLYASITSVLSLDKDKPTYKKIYKYYYDKMMGKVSEAKKTDTSAMTEKQKDNWLDWDTVLVNHSNLRDAVEETKADKALSEDKLNTLIRFLLLSLYVDVAPRRNQDYLCMYVYYASPKEKLTELKKDKNYVIIRKKMPSEFIFNIYKTSKTYGQQVVLIPEALANTIAYYLKRTDSKKREYVSKLLPFENDNAITRALNAIFGKKVGSSMLRHIYLSSKYNVSDMKADAEAMGHSLDEQKKYLKGQPEGHKTESQPSS